MGMPKKIYMVWKDDDDCYYQYDSIQDAVSEHGGEEEHDDDGNLIKTGIKVYEAKPILLGEYIQTTSVRKIKGKK